MKLSVVALLLFALPAWGGNTPAGQACAVDSECVEGNICDKGFCAPLSHDRRIIPPFYFSKKGQQGYRDIVPLGYFHHWGQQTDNLVAFPWFWRFRDKAADDTTPVIPLPLLMWWTKTGTKSTFIVPFLLAGSSFDKATGEHWRVWFPFLFDHVTKDERTVI